MANKMSLGIVQGSDVQFSFTLRPIFIYITTLILFSSLTLQQGVGNRRQIRYGVHLDIFCYMVDLSSSG